MNEKSLVSSLKLQTLVRQVDARYSVDPEVENLLVELAEEFVDSVTNFACALAKHRPQSQNASLSTQDVNLHLQRTWNIHVPGFEHDPSNVDLEAVLYDEAERLRMKEEKENEDIVYKDMQARERDLRKMQRNKK